MAAYDLPGADFIPGLTAQDYSLGQGIVGEEAGLLDYTPPDVRWQAPLIPLGENVFESFVKTRLDRPASWELPGGETYTATTATPWYPELEGYERKTGELDLLQEYNRRYSRPLGVAGSLPESTVYPGQPETMAEFGERKHKEMVAAAGGDPIGLYPKQYEPPPLFQDIHQKLLRNPYLAYSGEGTVGMGGAPGLGGTAGQPEGYSTAYPIYGYGRPLGTVDERRYALGSIGDVQTAGGDIDYFKPRFTTDIDLYPHFPSPLGDPYQQIGDSPWITIGQTSIPTASIKEDKDWFWL